MPTCRLIDVTVASVGKFCTMYYWAMFCHRASWFGLMGCVIDIGNHWLVALLNCTMNPSNITLKILQKVPSSWSKDCITNLSGIALSLSGVVLRIQTGLYLWFFTNWRLNSSGITSEIALEVHLILHWWISQDFTWSPSETAPRLLLKVHFCTECTQNHCCTLITWIVFGFHQKLHSEFVEDFTCYSFQIILVVLLRCFWDCTRDSHKIAMKTLQGLPSRLFNIDLRIFTKCKRNLTHLRWIAFRFFLDS